MLILKKQTSGEKPQSQRFEYSKGVVFYVRPLTGVILRDLREQCTKTRMELNRQSRRMEPVEDVDDAKLEDLLADYILETWEGVEIQAGDGGSLPLAVTLESKKLILDQIALREFIWAAAQSLDISEVEQKNS
jgi:hypothetical protein